MTLRVWCGMQHILHTSISLLSRIQLLTDQARIACFVLHASPALPSQTQGKGCSQARDLLEAPEMVPKGRVLSPRQE